MQLEIWHIDGDSFHFGRRGLGLEESGVSFPSDSLFAALVARKAILHGDQKTAAFCAHFMDRKPPFALTSVFPRAGTVRFLPPPMLKMGQIPADGPRPKKLKRVNFVSERVFRQLIAGESLASLWGQTEKAHKETIVFFGDEREKFPKRFRQTEPKDLQLWKVVQRPRVAIERHSSASTIYHSGQTAFNYGCGLWFGIQWLGKKREQLANQVHLLLDELGYAGLGGERSSGFGVCQIKKTETVTFPDQDGDYWTTLSRYLVHEEETHLLQAPRAAYALQNVGGWVGTLSSKAQRRRSVNLLVEGSVLGPANHHPPGQMVDVQPDYGGNQPLDHAVWRNGFAVAVGVQVDEEAHS
ncbi:MAG: type III-A CRISPR-associated RAMP protein Csm4 [Chloroflexota bacterium]|nr:type III-A CRISPR-associated RAMP protein Csm4 [Chloroflexota bacterium]